MDVFDQGEKLVRLTFQILSSTASLSSFLHYGHSGHCLSKQTGSNHQFATESILKRLANGGKKAGSGISYLVLNVKQADQRKVRQAVATVDRSLITGSVYKKQAEPVTSITNDSQTHVPNIR